MSQVRNKHKLLGFRLKVNSQTHRQCLVREKQASESAPPIPPSSDPGKAVTSHTEGQKPRRTGLSSPPVSFWVSLLLSFLVKRSGQSPLRFMFCCDVLLRCFAANRGGSCPPGWVLGDFQIRLYRCEPQTPGVFKTPGVLLRRSYRCEVSGLEPEIALKGHQFDFGF